MLIYSLSEKPQGTKLVRKIIVGALWEHCGEDDTAASPFLIAKLRGFVTIVRYCDLRWRCVVHGYGDSWWRLITDLDISLWPELNVSHEQHFLD